MSFFDSDIVKAEMADIHQLQEEVYSSVMNFPYMNAADKTEHINLLSVLVEKQKVMYARLSLSDDPDAEIMKQEMTKSAEMMGLPKGYVTETNLHRSAKLKMLGNGVVPQQAALAIRLLTTLF